MARGYLTRARRILTEAETHHGEGAWNMVVRRCQEAVELALKGALRKAGLEVPKIHDVSAVLAKHKSRFEGRIVDQMEQLSSISRTLRQDRELSFYGDEEAGVPAEELFTQQDAEQALEEAKFVLEVCREFIV